MGQTRTITMKRLWQKHKKKVYGASALLMFLLMYGTIGAVEYGSLPLYEGTIRTIIFLTLWALFTYLTQRDRADKDEIIAQMDKLENEEAE